MERNDGQDGAAGAGQGAGAGDAAEGRSGAPSATTDAAAAPTHVRRGAIVRAVQATVDGETRNGAPVKAGDWVVEHPGDVQEVIREEAFHQTYERF